MTCSLIRSSAMLPKDFVCRPLASVPSSSWPLPMTLVFLHQEMYSIKYSSFQLFAPSRGHQSEHSKQFGRAAELPSRLWHQGIKLT